MADNTGNSFFNGQLDPSWNPAGAAPKVLPNQTSPWTSAQAASPYGMSVQMLAALTKVGSPAQRQWAEQQMFTRAGDPSGGANETGNMNSPAHQQVSQWESQYSDDPNVTGAMQQLMNGRTPQQVMQTMTGPGGNGLQGMDPNAWMQQINTMQNALTGIGVQADPTHGYSADSPFNPQNTNSPFYGSSAAGFGNPTSTSSGNNPTNAVNAAGTSNPSDIAYQNQLRQTAMDSPTYNPNGANTWGIQNGTAANLAGAFGGGVINPSTTAAPPPAVGTTGTVTPPQVAGQTLPGQTTTTTPEAIAAPGTTTQTYDQRTTNPTPSYFGGALGGTSTPPAASPAAPSPVTTQPPPGNTFSPTSMFAPNRASA